VSGLIRESKCLQASKQASTWAGGKVPVCEQGEWVGGSFGIIVPQCGASKVSRLIKLFWCSVARCSFSSAGQALNLDLNYGSAFFVCSSARGEWKGAKPHPFSSGA